ncbi:MAG: hypothetical protein LBT32_09385 [Peptococcaceae bacterium]|nr:hypothetical protein [Peptococcaceae bacterium]
MEWNKPEISVISVGLTAGGGFKHVYDGERADVNGQVVALGSPEDRTGSGF